MNNYNSYAPGCNVYGFNGGAAYTAPSPNFYQQQPQGQQQPQYVNPSEVMNMQNAFVNQMMVAQQQIQQQNQMQNNVYNGERDKEIEVYNHRKKYHLKQNFF